MNPLTQFKKTLILPLLIALALVGLAALIVVPALATPPSGFHTTYLAPIAQFDEIDTKAKFGDWEAEIETKRVSDLHVVEVTVDPGGTSGWHSHPGPSFGIVKSGTATFYYADDPTCTPHVIPTGGSFFEAAGEVHMLRNEGNVPLVNVVIQLVPTGVARRIDEPYPGNCPF
jgi:quercetin dioxygenase-like cupin family protein